MDPLRREENTEADSFHRQACSRVSVWVTTCKTIFLSAFEEIVIHQFKGVKKYTYTPEIKHDRLENPKCSIGNTSTHSWWMFHCHVSFRGISSINKGSFTRYRDSYSWICDASDATGKSDPKIWSSLKMVGCFRMIFIPWDDFHGIKWINSSRTKSPTKTTSRGKLATDIYETFRSPSGAERIQGWFQSLTSQVSLAWRMGFQDL